MTMGKSKTNDAIYKILCARLQNEDGFSFGTDLSSVANQIESAIAKRIDIEEGKLVRVVSRLDHGSAIGHFFPIGYVGEVTQIKDDDYGDLVYRINGMYWVSREEIQLVP